MKIRKLGDREEVSISFEGTESMTKQSMQRDVNINSIMEKYHKTGMFPVTDKQAQYADFSEAADFHAMMNRVREATELFESQPAQIRDHCRNDVAEFLELITNPARSEEAVELGLLERSVPPDRSDSRQEPSAAHIPAHPSVGSSAPSEVPEEPSS